MPTKEDIKALTYDRSPTISEKGEEETEADEEEVESDQEEIYEEEEEEKEEEEEEILEAGWADNLKEKSHICIAYVAIDMYHMMHPHASFLGT